MQQIRLQQIEIKERGDALQAQRAEIERQFAKLYQEQMQIVNDREQLAQEQRKLEILQKSLYSNNATPAASKNPGRKSSAPASKPDVVELSHTVVGQLEKVYMEPPGITFTARIDTGAETSSLNALDMTKFERDGKPYVRFHILNPATGKPVELERRIRKHKRIKEHDDESQRRPVVRMRVVLGGIDQRIDFSLVDRSNFEHQVLIGRNFLSDFAVVDVSKQFITKPDVK